MVEKTSSNYFGCYFYENIVSDASFAKRIVWAAKNAIFSQERKRWRMCEWGWMVKSLARGDKNRTIAPLTMDKNSSLSTAFSRLLFTPQLSYQSKNLPSTAAKTL
jgi:hypothetical protein